jgi:tape measure domain-containing protein
MNNKYSIVVEAATKQAERELKELGEKASNSFDKARVNAVKFEVGATKAFRNVTATAAKMTAAFAALAAGGMLARSLVQTADSYTLLDNKLKLVTETTFDLAAVQQQLYEQALRSNSSYGASVDLYARFARATQRLGTSQAELVRITETVNKAFIISGATQEEAGNAIVQLSQGMASGALRGEEFNSIMEQGSRVAQMLADYLETDVGGLRKLAGEGKITSEIIVNAFAASARAIDDEFSRMQTTIGQAMTKLRTVFGALVSDTNTAAGSTNKIAQGVENIATTIDQNRDGIIELFSTMLSLANGVVGAMANIGQSFAGWAAVKRGDLSLLDFARMGPEELSAWLAERDTPQKSIQARIDQFEGRLARAKAKKASVVLPTYRHAFDTDIRQLEDELTLLYAARANAAGSSAATVLAGRPAYPPPGGGSGGSGSGGTGGRKTTPPGAVTTGDIADFWRYQLSDRYSVQSRALDYEIGATSELTAKAVAAGQATPKDFWQIQAEERWEVHSRGLDAMIQAEEAAGNHMQELSQRTAEAMEQNFSYLYFDVMKNKFTSLRDFGQAVLDSLTRATADYLGQLTRVGLFGEKGGSGGLINAAVDWIGDLFKSAQGNVIPSGPDIQRYENQVVSRPTVFAFASGGRVGLMGEDGDEAIMPLSRMASGNLGVEVKLPDLTAMFARLAAAIERPAAPALQDRADAQAAVPDLTAMFARLAAAIERPAAPALQDRADAQGAVPDLVFPSAVVPGAAGARSGAVRPQLVVNVTNNHPSAGVRAEPSADGMGLNVIVEQIEGAIAGRLQRDAGLARVLDGRYRRAR